MFTIAGGILLAFLALCILIPLLGFLGMLFQGIVLAFKRRA